MLPNPATGTTLGAKVADFILRRLLPPSDLQSPAVVGLCGAQGIGKTTISKQIAADLETRGYRTLILGLDDIYLPRARRAELAREVHPLLAVRGVPGTHDIPLGLAVLDQARSGTAVALPQFDKAIDDRAPVSTWPRWESRTHVILLEGWCVGALPQADDALRAPINALEAVEDADCAWRAYVNAALAGRYQALFSQLDWLVLLAAPSFEIVSAWRKEQEAGLRRRQDVESSFALGMSDGEIDRFILHYERLTRYILSEMPGRADLVLALDMHRQLKTVLER